jgi:Trp operon repressor
LGLSLCKITRGSRELKRRNSPFKHMIRLYRESVGEPVSESDR